MRPRITYYDTYFIIDGQFRFEVSWFRQIYCETNETIGRIAAILNIPKQTIHIIIAHYNIPLRNSVPLIQFEDDRVTLRGGRVLTLQEIQQVYIQENTRSEEMPGKLGVSKNVWEDIIHYYGINLQKSLQQREERRRQTNLTKYGVEYPLQVELFKDKRSQTCMERWGDTQPTRAAAWQEGYFQGRGGRFRHQDHIEHFDEWGAEKFAALLGAQRRSANEWAIYFNVDPTTIRARAQELGVQQLLKPEGGTSRFENDLYTFLVTECGLSPAEVQRHVRHGIFADRREVDLYIPSRHLGIEFNGNFWHSSASAKYQDHGGRSRAHQKKSLDAARAGVFIFQIFEYEWVDPECRAHLKARLKTILGCNTLRVGARQCQVVPLSKSAKKAFLSQNHLQGNDHSSIALGLLHNDEIVACMSFVRPKNSKYCWELSRFCCREGWVVAGGASKLFTYFLRHYSHPNDTIVSYNDITKTQGALYEHLGFTCVSINPPNYIWINFHNGDIKTRYQTQAGGEKARMSALGYYRICDCGTKTWIYTCPTTGIKEVKGGDAQ